MSGLVPRYVDKDDVKAQLPLAYVCFRLGINLGHDGRGLCPFHDDEEPSFYLWLGDDGNQRWHCQPCGFGGDCYDLITRVEGVGFWDAVYRAAEMLDDIPTDYTSAIRVDPPREGPSDWAAWVAECQARAAEQPGQMARATRLAVDVDNDAECQAIDEFLRTFLGWGIDELGNTVMPHFDDKAELTGCKIREPSGRRVSRSGSKYEHLYGAWYPLRAKDVMITEGETDMAWAAYQVHLLGLPMAVVSLSRGAGSPPTAQQITALKGTRTIYLALDPDRAGTNATRTWVARLAEAGFRDIRLCRLPLERDLRDVRPDIPLLLRNARVPLPDPRTISAEPGGYVQYNKEGEPRLLTHWTLEPIATLAGGDDGPGYEVELTNQGLTHVDIIRHSDFASVANIRKWCNQRALMFSGTDKDSQLIAQHLMWRGSYTPEVFQTDRVGLHAPPEAYAFAGPSCVYPGGYEGKLPWLYSPGREKAHLEGQVYLPGDGGEIDWQWLLDFLALSTEEGTMHQFLGWLVASARRPEVRDFPLMFVTGPSGSGKSTIAKLGNRLMASNVEVYLGSVTPYTLMQALSATTSIPVFVDEWTRLSRKDTLLAFQGLIPTLYEGSKSLRGRADLQSVSYRMTSPVMVAGEDTMDLDRELDRMSAIGPTVRDQNFEALSRLHHQPIERIGALIHWYVASGLPMPPLVDRAYSSRPEYNQAVIRGGWRTLLAILDYARNLGEDVPTLPEEPTPRPEIESFDNRENVYERAVRECEAFRDAAQIPVVWADPQLRGTFMRPEAMIKVIEKELPGLQLPGKSRAIVAYFKSKYGVSYTRATPPLTATACRVYLIKDFHLGANDGTEPL